MVTAVSRDTGCRMNKDECLSTLIVMSVQPILTLYNPSRIQQSLGQPI